MLHKAIDSAQEHIQPVDADLESISKLALREVKPDEVWCGRMHLANDRYDRAHERFPVEYLERFATTLPGKSLMGGHNYDTLPLGRFYKSSVQKDDSGHYLDAHYYLPASSPYVEQVELGVLQGASIGYNAGKRVCDLCAKTWSPYGSGKDGCDHWPGAEADGKTVTLTYCPSEAHKAEAMEGSWVWAPCQFGAQSIPKSAAGFEPTAQGFLMWMAQQYPHGLKGAGQVDKTLEQVQAELLEAKAAHQTEIDEIKKKLAALEARAKEGEAYQAYLKAEINRMAETLEVMEPGAKAAWASRLNLVEKAGGSVEDLLPEYERIKAEFDQKLTKGNAQVGGAREDTQQKAEASDPWFRPRRRAA